MGHALQYNSSFCMSQCMSYHSRVSTALYALSLSCSHTRQQWQPSQPACVCHHVMADASTHRQARTACHASTHNVASHKHTNSTHTPGLHAHSQANTSARVCACSRKHLHADRARRGRQRDRAPRGVHKRSWQHLRIFRLRWPSG